MEREHHDIQTQGQGEFEVKEQDRWLPIANGLLLPFFSLTLYSVTAYLPFPDEPKLPIKKFEKDSTTNVQKNTHPPFCLIYIYTHTHICKPLANPSCSTRRDRYTSLLDPTSSNKLHAHTVNQPQVMRCNLESGCSTVQSPDITHARPSCPLVYEF